VGAKANLCILLPETSTFLAHKQACSILITPVSIKILPLHHQLSYVRVLECKISPVAQNGSNQVGGDGNYKQA